jgi:hypothetical protein
MISLCRNGCKARVGADRAVSVGTVTGRAALHRQFSDTSCQIGGACGHRCAQQDPGGQHGPCCCARHASFESFSSHWHVSSRLVMWNLFGPQLRVLAVAPRDAARLGLQR